MADEVKYECVVCDERGFKSRGDWLFHLVLERHNLKARENMQQLYLESDGNMYVISEIGGVDNSSVLEYVSGRIPSFSNFVSFKPQAELCVIVCSNGSDFGKFAAVPHVINGVKPRFRDYLEIPPAEWKSYFNKTETNKQGENGSAPTSTASSSPGKRTHTGNHFNLSSSTERKVPKLESASGGPSSSSAGQSTQVARSAGSGKPTSSTSSSKWTEEITALEDFIMMPEAGRKARTTAITELKALLKPTYPNCEFINVGFDFLGFDLEKGELKLYFDATGITNPDIDLGPVRTILETDAVVRSTKTHVYNKLKLTERGNGAVKEVKCDGDNLKFVHVLYGVVPLNVTLLFKPFKLAQTVLLCKQLYFSSSESMSLVKMVVFWAMKNGFAEEGLASSLTIYWLVYFYLMHEKGKRPVIELQKSCNYQIIDEESNVAFSYHSSLLYKLATKDLTPATDGGKSQTQLLLSWFQWAIYTLGNPNGKGVSRRTSLLCPRFGVLIDKVKFRICRPAQTQKDVKKEWGEELARIGFEVSMWGKLGKLRTLDTLSIQHPLYIDDNISQAVLGKWNKTFFKFMRKTKNFLFRLVRGELQLTLLATLAKDYRVPEPKTKGRPWKIKAGGGNDHDSEGNDEGNSEGEEGKPPETSNSTFCEDNDDGGNDFEDGDDVGDPSLLGPNPIETLDTTVTLSAVHPSNYQHWASEITHMMSTLTLTDTERYLRTAVITHLKTTMRTQYRNCELIPVGADFLGFNVDKQNFHMYFDYRGITNPSNPNSKRNVEESNNATHQLQSSIFKLLKSREGAVGSGPVSLREVKTTKINKKEKFHTSITFQCIVRGLGQINCTLFLRPFRLAETALLCKQLFLTNPEARTLLTLIIYWMTQRSNGKELVACFLSNPFVIVWLVHFFLARKNVLPGALRLQKSCKYEIIDKNPQNDDMNVGFTFDPSILIEMFSQSSPLVSQDNVKSVVELLVEWFVYMELMGRQGSPTERNVRRHYVIAPRVGKLIDKQEFKVCIEKHFKKAKQFGQTGIDLRTKWRSNLLSLGYNEDLWKLLVRQRLRDCLYIQHPFYLSINICQHVKQFEAHALFDAIRVTKVKLTGLVAVAGTQPNVSIREALSS